MAEATRASPTAGPPVHRTRLHGSVSGRGPHNPAVEGRAGHTEQPAWHVHKVPQCAIMGRDADTGL